MTMIDTLTPSNYLGQALSVDFDQVRVITPLGRLEGHYNIVRGAYAVMLRSVQGAGLTSASQAPGTSISWNRSSFQVLRLKDVDPVTEPHGNPNERAAHASLSVLTYDVLGTFMEDANARHGLRFAGDAGALLAANAYGVFAPSSAMLQMVVNGGVLNSHRIHLGMLRESEGSQYLAHPQPVHLSMLDVRGKRSAMFGKTRLGKSNVVKLLVQGMLDVTEQDSSVGQLIFDVNGEYANDNPQDGGSVASSYASRCLVYFLSKRNVSGRGKLLRFNLFERTDRAFEIIRELLPPQVADSEYVRTLLSCRLPALERDASLNDEQAVRQLRKIMLYWTIMADAGFAYDEQRLTQKLERLGFKTLFNPCFSQALRLAAYQAVGGQATPPTPKTFREMATEMMVVSKFVLLFGNDPNLMRNGAFLFDLDELIMARFLVPSATEGTYVLRPCLAFHSPEADNFIDEILHALHIGQTVIVDLGSANEQVIRYFAKTLSVAVFQEQERKFVNNQLNGRYVQIYFEEAHMIFPPNAGNVIDVYSRFAKEGAKFNIGIVYSTQSPSTINQDLLAQTENFFIGHLSSDREAAALASVQYAFKGSEDEIMRSRSPGYMRMLSYSNRYVIPVQANRYTGQSWRIKDTV